jgi:Domain of unknown function (DUF1996)
MIKMDALKAWTTLLSAVAVATVTVLAVLGTAPAASAASADHGASFSVRCDFSHRASDDPIVYPGKPGASHSHAFFGNESTDAFSTYRSMLKKGKTIGTTCTRPLDTAGYWMPTVRWGGQTIKPDRAVFYYRAGGKDHKKVKPFEAGLKMITNPGEHVKWRCGRRHDTNTPPRRCSKNITDSPGPEIGVRFTFPDCSNGKLDSHNHMSHMAYAERIDGEHRCPSSHPIPVPVRVMNVTFPLPTSRGPVRLSSGNPSTAHADFFNTWNQGELRRLVSTCINDVGPSKPRPEGCKS